MLKIIAGNFSVRFFSAISSLLIAITISQHLGASGKGEQSIILASITFILLLENIVGGASIIYLTPRLGLKNLLFTAYSWSILVSSACYFILCLFPWLNSQLILSISVLSALNSIISINSSLLIGKEKIQNSNLINLFIPLITLIALYLQFKFGVNSSAINYIYSLYIAYIFTLLLSFYFITKLQGIRQDSFSIKEMKPTFISLFFFGFQNQLAHIFQLLSFRISYFVLEENWGKKSVGIYSNGLSIVESIWMITSSICLYQYARISNSKNKEYALELTEKLTKLGLLMAFIGLSIVVFIPSSFYVWLFGKDFFEMNIIILYMAPGIWIFNYALIIGHYFSGVGKYHVNAIASFAGLIVTILFSTVIFSKLSIYQAALTAVVSYLTTSIVVIHYYLKEGGKFVLFPSIKDFLLLFNIERINEKRIQSDDKN